MHTANLFRNLTISLQRGKISDNKLSHIGKLKAKLTKRQKEMMMQYLRGLVKVEKKFKNFGL